MYSHSTLPYVRRYSLTSGYPTCTEITTAKQVLKTHSLEKELNGFWHHLPTRRRLIVNQLRGKRNKEVAGMSIKHPLLSQWQINNNTVEYEEEYRYQSHLRVGGWRRDATLVVPQGICWTWRRIVPELTLVLPESRNCTAEKIMSRTIWTDRCHSLYNLYKQFHWHFLKRGNPYANIQSVWCHYRVSY